ncbi:phosphoribosylanthranilate isomerase [Marinobacterium sp. xm-d-564]|uniref:phosphoribosylanthranilate isomerase n=1 Tax=unclassified Marinobacterium TaxID=2644139 RepID=UPI001A002AAB|nr:N-(5'-phosphoribosyl)anthranilate isomerase [Marinobacterium sp. xm-d-543]NRP59132.1 N-(5'-phosphoribosyl)anthranilate isomerase [Marinobacterium sp. xm-d-564]NRQ23608.1 N-(5'-phosphoribosyl)anthranilate isomerase [Marinobacterium sp. xm-m-312]
MRTRVKICGITNIDDALSAADAGCDALGFVFYAKSPRAVTPEQAAEIISKLPAFVTSVALFVNESAEVVNQVIATAGVDLLQFHGDESAEFCSRFSRPYIKALRMKPELDLTAQFETYASSQGILLDAYTPGIPGGTGEMFDWSRIPTELATKIILAGGLSAENVAEAIAQVSPYAVDVSGGVEASKGIKDSNKMTDFMNEVYRANNR